MEVKGTIISNHEFLSNMTLMMIKQFCEDQFSLQIINSRLLFRQMNRLDDNDTTEVF